MNLQTKFVNFPRVYNDLLHLLQTIPVLMEMIRILLHSFIANFHNFLTQLLAAISLTALCREYYRTRLWTFVFGPLSAKETSQYLFLWNVVSEHTEYKIGPIPRGTAQKINLSTSDIEKSYTTHLFLLEVFYNLLDNLTRPSGSEF